MQKKNKNLFLLTFILSAFFLLSCQDFVLLSKDQFNNKVDNSGSSSNNSNTGYSLTTANYNLVSGQDIVNNIGSVNDTGAFLNSPFNANTVIYGVTAEGNYLKMEILTAASDLSLITPSYVINIGFTIYDKNNPLNILISSASTSINSSYYFDFESNTNQSAVVSSTDFWFDATSATLFNFTSYNSAKFFIAP